MKYYTTWSKNEGGCGHLHRSFDAAWACAARGRRVYYVTGRSAIESDRVRFFREAPGVFVVQCPECGAPWDHEQPLCPECGALR
jgi:rubrerythrin